MRALLAHGADANAADEDGWTVLHAACRGGDVELVRTLVEEFHADPNAADADDETPLDYVRELMEDEEDELDPQTVQNYKAIAEYLTTLG